MIPHSSDRRDRGTNQPRLLVGNLTFETDLLNTRDTTDPHVRLSEKAMQTLSDAATLLRVVGEDGDLLWTPKAVDPRRIPDSLALPRPMLISGDLASVAESSKVLSWGACPTCCRLGRDEPPNQCRATLDESAPLRERLFASPLSSVDVARTVNHRSFLLEAATFAGLDVDGICLIETIAELELEIHRTGGRPWIVKAPLSTAGRDRVIGDGATLTSPARDRIEGLLERQGSLLLEPWLERTADFGCAGICAESGVEIIGIHQIETDSRGRFLGVTVSSDGRSSPSLRPGERHALLKTARAVGESLSNRDYRGPFGIDSFRYRSRTIGETFRPLCEINARMTFGMIAHCLVERICEGISPPHLGNRTFEVRLRFGRGANPVSPSQRVVPLLHAAGADDDYRIWLEIDEPVAISLGLPPEASPEA